MDTATPPTDVDAVPLASPKSVERVSRGMKQRKKIAVVALARKLPVRLWAMLRDNTPWHEPTMPRNNSEVGRCAAGGKGFSPRKTPHR